MADAVRLLKEPGRQRGVSSVREVLRAEAERDAAAR